MLDFGRLITAMITPMDQEGRVNYQAAADLALRLLEEGSDGLVVAGTTGESPTLSNPEKLELFRVVKEAVGDRAAVLAGTGGNNTAAAVELSREAAATGIDGLLVVVPYYNKPNQAGLFAHFKAVAAASSLPVMLYNVPGRTGQNLAAETVAQLAAVENIVAIKEASGNLDQVTQLLRLVPTGFRVYSGDDSLTLPMTALGAHGVVSVAAHVVGRELKTMITALVEGRVEEAAAMHRHLFPVFKALFITSNPVPLKAAMNLLGFPAGKPRLPLVAASAAEEAAVKEALRQVGRL